jgi:trans-aconitate methyltransferase
MVKWVDQPSLVPFLSFVADMDREAFRSFVVNRMIDKAQQNDGRCFETFRRINVSAQKFGPPS